MQLIEGIVNLIMDSLEAIVGIFIKPSFYVIRKTFYISLIFVGMSFLLTWFDLLPFVSPAESITASIILLILTLIDAGNRASMKGSIVKIKGKIERSIQDVKNRQALDSSFNSEIGETYAETGDQGDDSGLYS